MKMHSKEISKKKILYPHNYPIRNIINIRKKYKFSSHRFFKSVTLGTDCMPQKDELCPNHSLEARP